jgi:hypothetical protein
MDCLSLLHDRHEPVSVWGMFHSCANQECHIHASSNSSNSCSTCLDWVPDYLPWRILRVLVGGLHILHNFAGHRIGYFVPVADIPYHNCCVLVLHGCHVVHHGPDIGLDIGCMVAGTAVGEANTVEGVVGKLGEPVGHTRELVPDTLVRAFDRVLAELVVGLGEVGPGLLGRDSGSGFGGFGWWAQVMPPCFCLLRRGFGRCLRCVRSQRRKTRRWLHRLDPLH